MRVRLWLLVLVVAYLSFVLAVARNRITDDRFNPWARLVETVGLALIPPNLIGPAWTAWRIGRASTLSGGEVLWAWSGTAYALWTLRVFSGSFQHDNVGYTKFLVFLAVGTLPVAILLAVFGKRPPGHGVAWAHHLGWGLTECNAFLWGMVAQRPFSDA